MIGHLRSRDHARDRDTRSFLFGTLLLAVLVLLLLAAAPRLVGAGSPLAALTGQGPTSPAAELAAIGARAREAGTYRFTADIEQTLRPRALPEMIGQSSQRVDMRVEGEVEAADRARLRIRSEEGGASIPDVTIIQSGGRSFVEVEGVLTPVENPAGALSPDADLLTYLAAAENVREIEPAEYEGETLTRYAFELSGPGLAEAWRRQMTSGLAAGQQAFLSPIFREASGSGELWVGANGLPRRQVIVLALPGITAQYDSESHSTIDFADFGAEFAIPVPVPDGDGWRLAPPAPTGAPRLLGRELSPAVVGVARDITPVSLSLLAGVVVALLLVRWYLLHPRQLYVAVAVMISLIMLVNPLLQHRSLLAIGAQPASAAPGALDRFLGLEDVSEAGPPAAPLRQGAQAAPDPVSRCGDGLAGADSDQDGLSDRVEYCYGTDPFDDDTDDDLITDGIEAAGYDDGTRVWPGNPLDTDANRDGLVDTLEWASGGGTATDIDIDRDGVPNFWDDDNDGDGVPDRRDLDPYALTEIAGQFDLSLSGSPSGYQYIDIQLRPENSDHLRYTGATLDWPDGDVDGPIQDRNRSKDDLRLMPMLLVRASEAPAPDLARNYGVVVTPNLVGQPVDVPNAPVPPTDPELPVELLVPLSPVGDGGQIAGYQGRVAYQLTGQAALDWQVEFVWAIQAQIDRRDERGRLVSSLTPVAQYRGEPFRLTGFQVLQSDGYESALFAASPDTAPNPANTDQDTFNLLFALNAGFLSSAMPEPQPGSGSTALEMATYRVASSNISQVTRWGLDAEIGAEYRSYAHQDEAFAALSFGRTADFLSTHFTTTDLASLVYAYEDNSGRFSLDEIAALSSLAPAVRDAGALDVNLDNDITMHRRRGVRLEMVRRQGLDWESLPIEEALRQVNARYSDVTSTLAFFSGSPEMTPAGVRGVVLTYLQSWYRPHESMVSVDDTAILTTSLSDQEIFDELQGDVELPTYLIQVGDLAQPGAGLRISASDDTNRDYLRAYADTVDLYTGLSLDNDAAMDETLLDTDFGKFMLQAKYPAKAAFALKNIRDVSEVVGYSPKHSAPAMSQKFGLLGAAANIGLAWYLFGTTTDFDDSRVVNSAVALAVVSTAFAVALFIISLNPIGAVFTAVLAIIDLIFYFTTGESIMDQAVQAVADFFYSFDMLSTLKAVQFDGLRTSIIPPRDGGAEGMVVGSTFAVRDDFTGVIEGSKRGRRHSSIYARYQGASRDSSAENVNAIGGLPFVPSTGTINPENFVSVCTDDADAGELTCQNQVGSNFRLTSAAPNITMTLRTEVFVKLRYEECVVGGIDCDTSTQNDVIYAPELGERPQPIVIDVLPATVEELWAWVPTTGPFAGHVFNPDPDGDGLNATLEAAANGQPLDWDSDDDGLSDGFEFLILRTRVDAPDSDGDGLSDRQEYERGSDPLLADSDGDGLVDGAEVFHFDGTSWVGGWDVSLPGGLTRPVMGDPLLADPDDDGLSDLAERDNGASPYAVNDAPRLILTGEPTRTDLNENSAIVVTPGSGIDITLELVSSGPSPITDTLALCFSAPLTSLTGGTLSGDRTPVAQTGSCAGAGTLYQYDFGPTAQQLRIGERSQTTFEAVIDSATPSQIITVTASLPYDDGDPTSAEDILESLPIHVDAENPEVTFGAPADGAILGGGIADFVLGGGAFDATSWVSQVDLTLPNGPAQATLGRGDETGSWAYRWTLPADGTYTLRARSRDVVGHVSAESTVGVIVDNTPPTVAISSPGANSFVGSASGGAITIPIAGTAADNLAGVERVQISTNDRPWREVDLQPGGSWSFDWRLPNDRAAQGNHELRVRAIDAAGNVSAIATRPVVVDVVPPTSALTDNRFLVSFPSFQDGSPITFEGVANDAGNVPQPSQPAPLAGALHSVADATIWLSPDAVADNGGGVTVRWLGDVNGDRLADLAVGLPGAAGGAGKITIVYGISGGWPVPPDAQALAASDTSFVGGAGIGGMLAAVGDVNRDGFDDLLVGDTADNAATLIPGRVGALGRELPLADGCPGCRRLTLPAGHTLLDLQPAGDINGDGFNDFFVVTDESGAVVAHLVLGDAAPQTAILAVELAALRVGLAGADAPVRGIGDRDGDQFDDFVADTGGGGLTLFHGAPLDPGRALDATTLDTRAVPGSASHVAALGDTNNDGLDDLAYGSGTSVTVLLGASDRGTGATTSVTPGGTIDFLAGVGDVTGGSESDLVVGTGGDALLYSDGDWLTATATLTGTVAVAAAPYAAGADWNADGSSDLLLVPSAANAAELGLGQPPAVNQGALPTPVAGAPPPLGTLTPYATTLLSSADRFVDNQLLCLGYTPCDFSIQNAVDAASPGDTIAIFPGVYAGAVISATSDLTLSGVSADAVFVEGRGGVAIEVVNATGVTLSHLTLRDATDAIRLTNAGSGGHATPALKTVLERLYIHDFSGHALLMDRVSTADLRRSTIVGSDNDEYLAVDLTSAPDSDFIPSWRTATPSLPAQSAGGRLLNGPGSDLYAVQGNNSRTITRFTPNGSSSTITAREPVAPTDAIASDANGDIWHLTNRAANETDGPIYDIEYVSDTEIYIAGNFDAVGNTTLNPRNIARWDGLAWRSLPANPSLNAREEIRSLERASNGALYVGANNICSGGGLQCLFQNFGEVWRLSGSTWSKPGGTNHVFFSRVYALALNSAHTRLYVGGRFSSVTDISDLTTVQEANSITYWNVSNNTWNALNPGTGGNWPMPGGGVWNRDNNASGCSGGSDNDCRVPGLVNDIAVEGNLIYISGQFWAAGTGRAARDDLAMGLVAFDESKTNCRSQSGDPHQRECWQTFVRDSFNKPAGDRRENEHARGVGPPPSHLAVSGLETSGVVNDIALYRSSSTSNEYHVAVGGDFLVNYWVADLNGNGQVNSNELAPLAENYVYVEQTLQPYPSITTEAWDGFGSVNRFPSAVLAVSPPLFSQCPGNALVGGAFANPLQAQGSSTWSSLGITSGTVHVLPEGIFDQCLIGGDFPSPDNTSTDNFAHYLGGFEWTRRYERVLWHYDASASSWRDLAVLPTFQDAFSDSVMVADSSTSNPTLYLIPGINRLGTDFRRLYTINTATNSWQSGSESGATANGAAALWANNRLYLARGGGRVNFDVYNPILGSWSALAPTLSTVQAGGSLAWDGDDSIYLLPGGNGKRFERYTISTDTWVRIGDGNPPADDLDTPVAINAGAGLAHLNNTLYMVPGGTAGLHAIGPIPPLPVPVKLSVDEVAFVASTATPPTITPTWTNLIGGPPLPDVSHQVSGSSVWVGSGWDPATIINAAIPLAQAGFLDPSVDLYRLTASSPFNAGYHTFQPDATVATDGCGGSCYTSIQDAIYSGANRVLVRPGLYEQEIQLVSGVSLIGSGAAATVIRPPSSGTINLVRAEGVAGSSIAGLTLDGDDSSSGISIQFGVRDFILSRSIVRNTSFAISVGQPGNEVTIVNNTIVNNDYGINAGGCASLDVRNTILAYTRVSRALSYGSGCTGQHRYNLYWQNALDLNVPPDVGELFQDPLFISVEQDDYRVLPGSPVIDAGAPGDPAPFGAGRVDIGYLEQGGASFYVNPAYCDSCPNDGLIWDVSAFSTIQPALDAAATQIRDLGAAVADPEHAVSVAPGLYAGSLDLPSHVRLVGAGAEHTVIRADAGQSAVRIDGVVGATLSGFTVEDASGAGNAGVVARGAANHVTLRRNLIRNGTSGAAGIRFEGRATGVTEFNTLVNNNGGNVVSDGSGTWISVRNSLLSNSPVGLRTQSGGRIFNDFNLLFNTTDYQDAASTGLSRAAGEIVGANPLLSSDGLARPLAGSPAIDAADPEVAAAVGGGTLADLGYHEALAVPVSIFLGDPGTSAAIGNSGVGAVEMGVQIVHDPTLPVTATLPSAFIPATVTSPGSQLSFWQLTTPVIGEGLYRVYSRGRDVVGNQESDPERWYNGAFIIDGTDPVVAWEPVPGDGNAPFELRVVVTDTIAGIHNIAEVTFEVGGVEVPATPMPTFADLFRDGRVYRAWISAPDGPLTVEAIATDRTGNEGRSGPVSLTVTGQDPTDSVAPTLQVSTPTSGLLGRDSINFSGTASDGDSGISTVEISVDGGYRWMPARVAGGSWSLDWVTPEDQEGISYPARIRARDNAGNETVETRIISVDNRPAQILDLDFSSRPGSFTLSSGNVDLTTTWRGLADGSGPAELFLVLDDQPATTTFNESTDLVSGGSHTVTLLDGKSYIHLTTRDAAGNLLHSHFGPWYVDRVVLDGHINSNDSEWQPTTQRLDDDERGGSEQALYASWDATNFFLGWQGAYWQSDGTLWAYLATGGPATTSSVDGRRILPFAADYAVEVDAPQSGTLYIYDGAAWKPTTLVFAQGESGSTEVELPFGTDDTNTVSLVAYAEDANGDIWASFPTTNGIETVPSLAGNRLAAISGSSLGAETRSTIPSGAPQLLTSTLSDFFNWTDLANDVPNANQPRTLSVELQIASAQAAQGAWGANNQLNYEIQVTNREGETLSGLALTLSASQGLGYVGPTTIPLNALPSGGSQKVAVTGQLGPDLSGLSSVTATVDLDQGGTPINQSSFTHSVDSVAPSVAITTNPGQVLGLGTRTILGTASDAGGSGVRRVEVSTDGTTWQSATGTRNWSAQFNVGGGSTLDVHARAVDLRGNTSAPVMVTFNVDSVPPDTTIVAPALIATPFRIVTGVATDPAPAGALVSRVEVQIDSNSAPWIPATGPFAPDTSGGQPWSYTWNVGAEDGVNRQIRARAIDSVGNVGTPTAWQPVIVDTVRPNVALTSQLTDILLSDYLAGNVTPSTPPILEGTASDGYGIGSVRARITDPSGAEFTADATFGGGLWTLAPELPAPLLGDYTAFVTATDLAGHTRRIGPFVFTATNTPPDAVDDDFATDEDTPLRASAGLSLLADNGHGADFDLDGDPLSIASVNGSAANLDTPVTLASGAVITVTTAGGFTFDPAGQFETLGSGASDTVSFVYRAFDGIEPSLTDATVTITIAGVNDPPTIGVDQPGVVVDEGDTATNSGPVADVDAGDVLALSASVGTVIDNGDGTWGWMWLTSDGPTESQTVTVTVTDADGASASTTFDLTVNNVDPQPTIVGAPATSGEGIQIDLTSTVLDPSPVDTFSYDWQVTKNGVAFAASVTDTLSFIPDDDGSYVVDLTVTDDDGGVGSDSVTITVINLDPVVSVSPASVSTQYSDPIPTVTITATDVLSDILVITATLDGGALAPLVLADNGCSAGPGAVGGTCGWSVDGLADLAPGSYTLDVIVTDGDGGQDTGQATLVVTEEDARATYTGPTFAATTSATNGTATIELRATIQDISAVSPFTDTNPGAILNATVTFEVVNDGATCPATLGLIDPTDPTTATATCDHTFDIGNADSDSFEVRVLIGGYYVGPATPEETVVTISKPLQNFITGGGYLTLTDSAGQYAGDVGTRANFGFNVKFNANGRNLRGKATLILRADGRTYKIKSNAIQSLGVVLGPGGQPPHVAEFESKANITDVTDPDNPISLGGNLTFQMRMTDNGEPGSADTLSITVYDKDGLLLFSTNWDGAQSVEQLLGGGNLQVR